MPLIMAEVLESESVGLGFRYFETIGPCEEGDEDEVRDDVVMLMGMAVGMAIMGSPICRGVEGCVEVLGESPSSSWLSK